MKYIGSVLDFTEERNKEIMKVFRQKLSDVQVIVKPQIFQMVADSPASRFWVSEKRAAIVVGAMESGKGLPKMRDNKREMFEEIYRRFLLLKRKFPRKPIFELVSTIVYQPAPKFYLTARTIEEFIYRIRKQQRTSAPTSTTAKNNHRARGISLTSI
ncbi:MAG: hypothetical protein ACI3YC_07115 [Alloprevotella sp.]